MKITDVEKLICKYLVYCEHQKQLSGKTIKAYRIDLKQYLAFMAGREEPLDKAALLD